jgi:hypothetical protein
MTDNFMRHFVAFCGTLVTFLAYLAGYYSGHIGWWWTGFSLIIIYVALYRFISVGNH